MSHQFRTVSEVEQIDQKEETPKKREINGSVEISGVIDEVSGLSSQRKGTSSLFLEALESSKKDPTPAESSIN